jgi:hypothetical protein
MVTDVQVGTRRQAGYPSEGGFAADVDLALAIDGHGAITTQWWRYGPSTFAVAALAKRSNHENLLDSDLAVGANLRFARDRTKCAIDCRRAGQTTDAKLPRLSANRSYCAMMLPPAIAGMASESVAGADRTLDCGCACICPVETQT